MPGVTVVPGTGAATAESSLPAGVPLARAAQRPYHPLDLRRNLDGIHLQEKPDRKAVHTGMNLKDEWDRLDSETRTWLLENPGCLVLPRAMSAKISKEAHGDIVYDPHGQVVLSRADHDFIREKAEDAGTIRVPAETEYRFFDTSPLPVIRRAPSGRHAAASPDEPQ
jgi:hypothetical protein